jgi:hypothetical protein
MLTYAQVMEDTFLSDANARMLTSLVELVQQEVYRFQASQVLLLVYEAFSY